MKITDALLGDHAVFYAQFDHLEQLRSSTNDSLAEVKSRSAMLAAALASHARLEEELLFSTLEAHIGSRGPLSVMRSKHDEIERSLERLPIINEVNQARELLLHIVAVARQHFAKEQQVLFPMANQTLSTETLINLGSKWAARRAITLTEEDSTEKSVP